MEKWAIFKGLREVENVGVIMCALSVLVYYVDYARGCLSALVYVIEPGSNSDRVEDVWRVSRRFHNLFQRPLERYCQSLTPSA